MKEVDLCPDCGCMTKRVCGKCTIPIKDIEEIVQELVDWFEHHIPVVSNPPDISFIKTAKRQSKKILKAIKNHPKVIDTDGSVGITPQGFEPDAKLEINHQKEKKE